MGKASNFSNRMGITMLGLNILQYYTVKYDEQYDKVIARTLGEVTPNDERKLIALGWIKISGNEYHFIKEEEPEDAPDSSLEDADIYDGYSS